jgi:hypothetical protein
MECWEIVAGFHTWRIPKMDGLFHGKSENKMDDLEVPPFQETAIWT